MPPLLCFPRTNRAVILWLCTWLVLPVQAQQHAFEHFERWQRLTEQWFLEGHKQHLVDAFSAAGIFVPYLVQQAQAGAGFPPGLDPLELANSIVSFHQAKEHVELVVPLLRAALDHYSVGKKSDTLGKRCAKNDKRLASTCQDLYSTLCWAILHSASRRAASKCVAEYARPRPVDEHFISPELVHRQLPALRHQPWWDAEEVPYDVLHRLSASAAAFQTEVLSVVNRKGFTGWNAMSSDLRLSQNEAWDAQRAWDAIQIYFDGAWKEGCDLFPLMCARLRAEESELAPLFNKTRYKGLVGTARLIRGYEEVPSLGIKLYRVWPKSAIKPHVGSPARLVHSIALQATNRSTITVGGQTRVWQVGMMHHFDDAFWHAVRNDDPSVERIVLAFVTWHPDLLHAQPEPAAATSQSRPRHNGEL